MAGPVAGQVRVRRLDGEVEVVCPVCADAVRFKAAGFLSLVESLNGFLRSHAHAAEPGDGGEKRSSTG